MSRFHILKEIHELWEEFIREVDEADHILEDEEEVSTNFK